MMIGGLLLLGLVIYVIVVLTRQKPTNQSVSGSTPVQDIGSAMNILNERFARGEINEEEYARKKAELRK
ncbi:MAG: SHOCT domain-containing protein [Eubacteriales bacterium]